MARGLREQEYDHLRRQLEASEYQRMLQEIQLASACCRHLATWVAVADFLHADSGESSGKDEILRSILTAHAAIGDPRWRTVLLFLFWPTLLRIHHHKQRWDADVEELWQNLLQVFLEVIGRLDVRQRPDRLIRKIRNDTLHRLHDAYRRLWRRSGRERPTRLAELRELAGAEEDPQLARLERQEDRCAGMQRLRDHVRCGHIREEDFLLLVGTRLYGRSIAEYARLAGISYPAARKRRARVEAVIRRLESDRR
jgi:hypothetical protein